MQTITSKRPEENPFQRPPNRRQELEAILACESDRALIVEILIDKYPDLLYVDCSHGKKDLETIPPDGLRIGDKEYFGIPTKPWRALELLCVVRNYTASMNSLVEHVWHDQTKIATFEMRNDLRKRLNDFFRDKEIQYHAEGIGAYLAIRSGPPKPRNKSFHDSHQIPTRPRILEESEGAKTKNQ